VVAAMCILTVRAVIVQLAFFLHMQVYSLFFQVSIYLSTISILDLCDSYSNSNPKHNEI
jgi:uncharacterized membrane protein